ncbi:MAG TPA: thiolase family protein [Candidatus Binatia bacterium]|nr:thiolase family protein [Candidatus Binatia bacterium]
MRDPARLRDRYAIAGIGLSRFGKVPGVSAMGFCLEASTRAIADCGIPRDAIDGVLCLMPAQMGEQHGWASRVAALLGITPTYCSTMDMGGATAIGMLQTAVMAVEAGFCEVVLCTFGTQTNPQGIIPQLFGSPWTIPYGDVGAITLMGHLARRQMHEHGITSEDYGHIAVTWRKHAQANPNAQIRKPMTLEDHQASRFINEPLRLLDCCLFTDGGGAFIVTSVERARDLAQTPALVSGLGQVHSSEVIRPWDDGRGGGAEAGQQAFRMAGCGPTDISVAQIYDAFTPRVVHDLVSYGFADWDEVGPLARDGQLTVGGKLPCNTAGGLLSEGHLSGMNHVAEAVRQVRGTSTTQVPNVSLSMVTGYGGAPHEPPPTVAYTVGILRKP